MPILEAALNTNGRQTIFELGATLPPPVVDDGPRSGRGQASKAESFEVHYTPNTLRRLQEKKGHVFSQIVTERGAMNDERDEDDHMQVDRAEDADEDESSIER